MPRNKDAYTRYRVIDQTLRQNGFVKTSKLIYLCSERLGKEIKERTIQKDIADMKEDSVLQMFAPIKYSHSEKAHYYPGDVEEIFPVIDLLEEDISALLFYGRTLNQYEGGGIFEDITNAIGKVLDSINIKQEYRNIAIETERVPAFKGRELLVVVLEALKAKKKLSFDYQRFGADYKTRVVSPLLLKEDKHMWYIVGIINNKEHFTTFALDRMSNVEIINESATQIEFDSEKHFKYSFGVTVPPDPPKEVIISFSPGQGNYIKALPIHETQKIIEDNSDELRISIMVKPTYEFYSKLLSYGGDAIVISPPDVIQYVKGLLKRAISNYS